MVLKRGIALVVAVVVPLLTYLFIIALNESSIDKDERVQRESSFDVARTQQVKREKPKPKEKPRTSEARQAPSLKPANVGSELPGGGLSFGLPQFDEGEFANIADDSLLKGKADGPMDDSSVDIPPKVMRRSPVIYPELARQQGISGYVTLNVLVNEEGGVEDVAIIDAQPPEIFDLVAENTVRSWRFEPATYNGKKVKVWAQQKVVFKLD